MGLRWRKQLEAGENNIMMSFVIRSYPLHNIIVVIKTRNVSWVGHVARMVQKRDAY